MKTTSFNLILAFAAMTASIVTLSSCEKENMGQGSMTVAMTDATAVRFFGVDWAS